MERCKGFRYNKKTFINRAKSTNPLAKLSYKGLQQVALELHLPANLQHKILLALVIAKKQGRDDIVNLLVKANRKRKVPTLGNGSYKMQQHPAALTSFNVLQYENNLAAGHVSELNENYFSIEASDDSISPILITNDKEPSFSNHNENQHGQTYTSCTGEGIDNMYIPAPLDLDINTCSTSSADHTHTIDLLLATPSCSFDSGFGSFTSLNYAFENENLLSFLNDDSFEVQDVEGSSSHEIDNPAEISIVDVLETLSENQ